MKLHANARTCPKSRRLLVERLEGDWSLTAAAEAAGVSERTAAKWLARRRAEGPTGLEDRSSAPRRVPGRLPADRVEVIEALRRLRMTAAEIAEVLGMALSTVSRWLLRIGLGRRSRLDPPEPPNRYERKRPGELIHVDVKKLGRIGIRGAGHRVTGSRRGQLKVSREGRQRRATGWEFVHVCVDDATRLALDWFLERGIVAERLLSDNTWAYTKNKDLAVLLDRRQILHKRTRPYSPQTNGKVCVLASRCRPVGRRGSPRLRV